jgi:diguanylate cyclase (GGDEF)-like protein
MALKPDIYHADLLVANPDGTTSRHPAGRFAVSNGEVHLLENYHDGQLANTIPSGKIDDLTEQKINNPGPDLSIASTKDIESGKRMDFIKEHELQQPLEPQQQPEVKVEPTMPSVWYYTRAGHTQPHVLEFRQGKFMLDGNPLDDGEVATILDNVKTKVGKIRYANSAPVHSIMKMEAAYKRLRKADLTPEEALAHLDKLGSPDEKTNEAIASLRRHVFEDSMMEGVGNKYAYNQWVKQPRQGVHIGLDLNNFKQINDTHGHGVGDQAIKAFGGAMRTAADKTKTPEGQGVKIFRTGGDEAVAFAPSYEHAATFLHNLREHLSSIPPVMGAHKLSASAGIGHTPETADKALYEAKKQKAGHTVTTIPHLLAHSLYPGNEGAIQHEQHVPPKIEGSSPQPSQQPAV